MASKHFVDCVARVNAQSPLQRFQQGEDWGTGELEARMLTAENIGRIASLGPRYMVIVVVGGFHRRPQTLKKQHLQLGKASVLQDMRLGD